MEREQQTRLTSGEVSQLIFQYLQDSSSVCTLSFFLEKVEDKEIEPIIQHALQLSQTHLQKISVNP